MKKFQILRYIKKLRYLIVVITLLGCIATYVYVDKAQKYTAQVVIQYTNSTASNGTAPDGSPINPKEIYCSSVISDVKEELALPQNIDSIRSACSFEEILSDDEERRKNALLDDGKEYEDAATVYCIKYTANSSQSKERTRNILDSIMNNYYTFYSKKYIDSAVIPNNTLNISADKYDYLNCVEILESSTDDIIEYLEFKDESYPNFRSAKTGYSYKNLIRKYKYIKNNTISRYYALVLGEQLTSDKTELINYYQNRIAKNEITIQNLNDHIEKQRMLLDQFGDKVTHSNSTVAGAIGDNTDAIIEDVERYTKDYFVVDTTYDDLIRSYVDLKSQKNEAEIDIEYCNEILNTFDSKDVTNSKDTQLTRSLVSDMDKTIAELNELYEILCETVDEQYEYSATKCIKALSGVFVEQEINEKLYLTLAVVLFFIVGCGLAVVIGRGIDIWEYLLYTDKKTGLANREKCDAIIDDYARKTLEDNFSCIVFTLDNLVSVNNRNGRRAGDSMLKEFGKLISESASEYGFVGYNGSNVFIALFEKCSKERAQSFAEGFKKKLSYSKTANKFDVSFGISESTADGIYEIRNLMQQSFAQLKKDKPTS